MTTPRITVAHCPLHGPSWRPKWGRKALSWGAQVVHFTEAYHAVPWLRRHPRWWCITGHAKRVDARGRRVAWDSALMIRKRGTKLLAHGCEKVADQIGHTAEEIKYHPERFMPWAVIERHGVEYLIVGLHPQPGESAAVGKEYAHHMAAFQGLVRRQRDTYGKDLRVIAMGDMQHGHAYRDHPWNPAQTFAALDMEAEFWHIDAIAWSANLDRDRKLSAGVDRGANGQDHPWRRRTLVG